MRRELKAGSAITTSSFPRFRPLRGGHLSSRTDDTVVVDVYSDYYIALGGPTCAEIPSYIVTLFADDERLVASQTVQADDLYQWGGSTTKHVTFAGLNPGTAYEVSVVAINSVGFSDTVTFGVTTDGVQPSVPPVIPEEESPVCCTTLPTAPASGTLAEGARGELAVPTTGILGERVTVSVGSGYVGQTLYGWLYSTPVALGSAVVDADGNLAFTLPTSVEPGVHRIAVTDASNSLVGWGDIRLSAAPSDEVSAGVEVAKLARTGGNASPADLSLGALLLLTGGAAIHMARRRLRSQAE